MEVREPSATYLVRRFKRSEAGEIPLDWEDVPLGSIAEVNSGGTPSRKVAAYWGGDIPWVTTAELDKGEVFEASQFLTEQGLHNSAAKLLAPGTLLMALYGQGKTRGKCAVLRIAATTNQACASISMSEEADSEFVRYNLTSRYEFIRSLSNSGSQENLSGAIVKQIRMAMPPTLSEQRTIAQALADADALINSLEQLLTKKRQIKQGAMQELLTGKRRLPGFDAPWVTDTLDLGISELIAGVSVNADVQASGIDVSAVLKTSALSAGIFNPLECKVITAVDMPRAKTRPRRDTLLISRMNTPDLVGEVAYIDRDYDWLYLPDRIWMALPRSAATVRMRWLAYLLASPPFKRKIADAATGTSGSMKNISKGALLAIPVRFPSVDEQDAIAQALSEIDTDITAIEARLAKARDLKQAMMQVLLTGRIRLVEPQQA